MEGYNQPQGGFQQPQPMKPNNNMVLAIISAVLGLCSPCCIGLILGIISIVFSTQVDSKYMRGDYAGAETSAKNAKLLAFIAIGVAVIGLILNIILFTSGFYDEFMEGYMSALEQA